MLCTSVTESELPGFAVTRANWQIVEGALREDAAALAEGLRRAIERDELVAFYHPVVALRSGRPVWFEALIRWNRPGVRVLSPAEFIGIAEHTGVVNALGTWMLDRAIADCARWRVDAPDVGVSINVAPAQFADDTLVDAIDAALLDGGLPAELFEIEITERAIVEYGEVATSKLAALRERGVKVVLDDFGSGTSSLTVLDRTPLDEIKIDIPVIAALEDVHDRGRLVEAILRTARIFDLKVIAEGVDTTQKLRRLHTLGCEFGQGILFGEPRPMGRVLKDLIRAGAPHTP
jgi:EAL domain-containing protein (putative c-di-GMP-specific phosphodiesterase class I)